MDLELVLVQCLQDVFLLQTSEYNSSPKPKEVCSSCLYMYDYFFLFDFAPCTVLIRDCMIIYFTIMISQNLGALDPYLCKKNRVKKALVFARNVQNNN